MVLSSYLNTVVGETVIAWVPSSAYMEADPKKKRRWSKYPISLNFKW